MPVIRETRVHSDVQVNDQDVQTSTPKIRRSRVMEPGEKFNVRAVTGEGLKNFVRGEGTVGDSDQITLTFWNGHTDRFDTPTLSREDINKAGIVGKMSKTLFRRRPKETVIRYEAPSPEPSTKKV